MENENPLYYDICPVCFWENDPIQNEDENFAGGANRVSLKEARENYKIFGACRRDILHLVREPLEEEK